MYAHTKLIMIIWVHAHAHIQTHINIESTFPNILQSRNSEMTEYKWKRVS